MKIMCLWESYKKKMNIFKKCYFASLTSLKKGVVSRVGSGSGSISQWYESGDLDPDPLQNVTDSQH